MTTKMTSADFHARVNAAREREEQRSKTTNAARSTKTDITALDHFRWVLETKVDYAISQESEQLDRLEKMVQERRANLAAARYYPEMNIARAAGELVRRSEATQLLAEQLKQLDQAMAHDR